MLLEAVYGKEEYLKSGQPVSWRKVAEKPFYVDVPTQGYNECGFYAMKYASTYDGDRIVEHIDHQDVRFPHI